MIEPTGPAENRLAAVDSIKNWLKIATVAFGIVIIVMVIIGVFVAQNLNDQRLRDRKQDAQQLEARVIEGCHNYNRDQTDNRRAAHQNVFALAHLTGADVDESKITELQKTRLSEFDSETAIIYPYRKCDPVCAFSYTDKSIEDCPSSDNEEGN